MKEILLLGILFSVLLGGCAFITPPLGGGAQASSNVATGEAWYVKNNFFLFFLLSSEVYYCDGKGTCREAQIR